MKKLLHSKWTAVVPINKEKHFVVIKVHLNKDDAQVVESLVLEAILTKRMLKLKPSELGDGSVWQKGWS
jgi:tryptophan-rich hypothetical protein